MPQWAQILLIISVAMGLGIGIYMFVQRSRAKAAKLAADKAKADDIKNWTSPGTIAMEIRMGMINSLP